MTPESPQKGKGSSVKHKFKTTKRAFLNLQIGSTGTPMVHVDL
jgi:hypothetical protein